MQCLWSIVTLERAERNCKNRLSRALAVTPVEDTRQIYVDMIAKKVAPIGDKKMPIKIQKNNTRPY